MYIYIYIYTHTRLEWIDLNGYKITMYSLVNSLCWYISSGVLCMEYYSICRNPNSTINEQHLLEQSPIKEPHITGDYIIYHSN